MRSALRSPLFALTLAASGLAQEYLPFAKEHVPPGPLRLGGVLFAEDLDGDSDMDLAFGSGQRWERVAPSVFRSASMSFPPDARGVGVLAVADFSGDGHADVVGGLSGGGFGLWRSDGMGGFSPGPSVTPLSNPLLAFDADADGDLDLLQADSARLLQLYRNDGAGNFAAPVVPFASTRIVRSLRAGDFDGDGDDDVMCGHLVGVGDVLEIYWNDGTGQLTNGGGRGLSQSGQAIVGPAIADYDGDGDLDVALEDGGVQLYFNDGSGQFTDVSASRLPAGRSTVFVNGLLARDVDADGDLDIVQRGVPFFLNDGSGSFVAGVPPVSVPAADLLDFVDVDADGDLDLLTLEGELLWNDGQGQLQSAPRSYPPEAIDNVQRAFDLDGDGDLDLIGGSDGEIFRNVGGLRFEVVDVATLPAPLPPSWLPEPFDADGDGDPDILFPGFGRSSVLWENRGGMTFVARTVNTPVLGLVVQGGRFNFADGNGDGVVDLFARIDGTFQLGFYRNDGFGNLTLVGGAIPQPGSRLSNHVVADLDGDGDQDIVWVDTQDAQQRRRAFILLNDGAGTFSSVATLPNLGIAPQAGDLDGDGLPEIVGMSRDGSFDYRLEVYRNAGAGQFNADAPRPIAESGPPIGVFVVDRDADGDRDVALFGTSFSSATGRYAQFFDNDGAGGLTTVVRSQRNDVIFPLAAGDFDEDGDLDWIGFEQPWAGARLHLRTPFVAALGQAFPVELYAAPVGGAATAGVLLFSPALANVPLSVPGIVGPLYLEPVGLESLVTLPVPVTPGAKATLPLVVPARPELRGLALHFQALLLEGDGTLRLTGATGDEILR